MLLYRKRDLKLHESVVNRSAHFFSGRERGPALKHLCLVNENCGKRTGEDMDIRRTVLLADANEEFRTLVRKIIDEAEEFSVVGSVGDGRRPCAWRVRKRRT